MLTETLLSTLETEWHRAARCKEPLSVVMFDVDHFKIFNDMHGHDQGDRVLCRVAEIFRDTLRGHDIACRYGGEEFVAILPATPASGAQQVGERIRAAVAASEVDGLKVTVSVGIACVPWVVADSPRHLLELADGALYDAKRAGRDRVSMAGEVGGEAATG